MIDEYVITLDLDWAPDFIIDSVANYLIKSQVCATWFVTHPSPAVERLRQHTDLFELGIHPNFLPGSTQGRTPEEILQYCMQIVPDARSMRTHGLVQSSSLIGTIIKKTPLVFDVSLFLPHHPFLQPCVYPCYEKKLIRIPYYWEDDFEMLTCNPHWKTITEFNHPGLKVINFHPVHIFLNSKTMESYNMLKLQHTQLQQLQYKDISPHLINRGYGTRTMFEEIIQILQKNGSRKICNLGESL